MLKQVGERTCNDFTPINCVEIISGGEYLYLMQLAGISNNVFMNIFTAILYYVWTNISWKRYRNNFTPMCHTDIVLILAIHMFVTM